MASSDKARFYLERSVPELHSLERKGLFSREEISSIAKKRSEFEHLLNSPAGQPRDWAQYYTYEFNLRSLQRKRAKRQGLHNKKASGLNESQKRIFFILDRATRKFHGDVGLWMLSLEFAKKEETRKKFEAILTKALRLHPTRPDLWQYAAAWAIDVEGDMAKARSFMQRGLRFCKSQKGIWKEYAKLEMGYLAKIAGRRRILGLDGETTNNDESKINEDDGGDMIAFPKMLAEDINPQAEENGHPTDDEGLRNLASTPALTGAIPMAIFDAAMKQFHSDAGMAEDFFEMFAEFDQVPCIDRILQHVLDHLRSSSPGSLELAVCGLQMPLLDVDAHSSEFPSALKESLSRIKTALDDFPERQTSIAQRAVTLLTRFAEEEGLDPTLEMAIGVRIKQLSNLK